MYYRFRVDAWVDHPTAVGCGGYVMEFFNTTDFKEARRLMLAKHPHTRTSTLVIRNIPEELEQRGDDPAIGPISYGD